MSVINQMLRDLDARDASEQERVGLPARLRPLPPAARARRRQWQMLAIGIGIGAVVAGGLVALTLGSGTSVPLPVTAPTAPAVPAPPAAASPAPTLPPPSPKSSFEAGEMKLSTLISSGKAPPAPPAIEPGPKGVERPPEKVPGQAAVKLPADKAPDKPPAKAAVEEISADTRIDKRSKGDARELSEAEYRKGMQAVKRGEGPAATPLFMRALEFDPAAHKARQALLSVLVGGKRWSEAQQVAQAGLDLDPTQSGWATIIARLQFEQGDIPGAVQTLERYAVHAPHDADYQGLFAYLLQKQSRPAEAAQRFKLALQSRPNEGRWWFGLGLALEQAGNPAESREAYARARQAGNLPADMAKVVEQKLR